MRKLCPESLKISKHVQKIFQQDLDRIEADDWEPFLSYRKQYTVEWLIQDFLKTGKRFDRWELIPRQQYRTLLERYMDLGPAARIPDSVVDSWIHFIMKNTAIMMAMAKIYGRSLNYPHSEIRRFLPELPDGLVPALEYMHSLGFFTPEDNPYTDAAAGTLYDILKEYRVNLLPEEKLILVNRCLDVTHWHGKMADKFLEGGSQMADEISGRLRNAK